MNSLINSLFNKRNIHLDFASTTPVDPQVVKAMRPYWSGTFFNPSASYLDGQNIKKVIRRARATIARMLQVKENEVIFTQGGTESVNLALIGVARHALKTCSFAPHILISGIEHPAVTECAQHLKDIGIEIELIPVLERGVIDVQALEKMINERTVLISLIGVSNETGVIQPVHKVTSAVKRFKNAQGRSFSQYPFVHCDASQQALTKETSVDKLGVDLLTLDGSKIYAPKMSGILAKKNHVEMEPLVYGGGQEFGLRSGTESVTNIMAFETALSLVEKRVEADSAHFAMLKETFVRELEMNAIPYEINGSGDIVPNILNICIRGLSSDFAVIQLDEYGVNCAAMTSCAGSKGVLYSEVLRAMGKKDCAGSSLRFSFGRSTKPSEIRKAVKILRKVCTLHKVV